MVVEYKCCKSCGESKPLSEYYDLNKCGRFSIRCKDCDRAKDRKRHLNDHKRREVRKIANQKRKDDIELKELNKLRSSKFYKSISGRSRTLLSSAKRRSHKFEKFDIDLKFIMDKLSTGICEVTGIKFDFEPHPTYAKNPYSPSIDRIDSKIGYIKSNVRIVIWQYNLMKGELCDSEILEICKILCERSGYEN